MKSAYLSQVVIRVGIVGVVLDAGRAALVRKRRAAAVADWPPGDVDSRTAARKHHIVLLVSVDRK